MLADPRRARRFGEVAELYDRSRPGYPAALYDDLLALGGAGRRALEAGAGTGRATVELARRGLDVLALEPDPAMAALARRATGGLTVEVEETPFEEWQGEAGSFDWVLSAQAWHWIDPDRGAAVARRALRPGGALAIWWNQAGDWSGSLREALDAAYERQAPHLAHSVINRPVHVLTPQSLTIEGFEAMDRRSYTWTERYDALSYTGLLQTHSDHRLLAPEQLEALVQDVGQAIEQVGGGEVAYPYRTDLFIARRT